MGCPETRLELWRTQCCRIVVAQVWSRLQRTRVVGFAMEDAIPAKRRRLADFSRGSYASHRAIERLPKAARDEGIPDSFSRTSQWRARSALATQHTEFGPLVCDFVLLLTTGPETVAAQHPMAMLSGACRNCDGFKKLFDATVARNPPLARQPWRIIMYADEIGHNPVGRDDRKQSASTGALWSLGQKH